MVVQFCRVESLSMKTLLSSSRIQCPFINASNFTNKPKLLQNKKLFLKNRNK